MIKICSCKVIEVIHFLIPNVLLIYTYFNLIVHEILDLKGIKDAISALLDLFIIIPSQLIIVIVSQQSKLIKSLSLLTIDLYTGNFFYR